MCLNRLFQSNFCLLIAGVDYCSCIISAKATLSHRHHNSASGERRWTLMPVGRTWSCAKYSKHCSMALGWHTLYYGPREHQAHKYSVWAPRVSPNASQSIELRHQKPRCLREKNQIRAFSCATATGNFSLSVVSREHLGDTRKKNEAHALAKLRRGEKRRFPICCLRFERFRNGRRRWFCIAGCGSGGVRGCVSPFCGRAKGARVQRRFALLLTRSLWQPALWARRPVPIFIDHSRAALARSLAPFQLRRTESTAALRFTSSSSSTPSKSHPQSASNMNSPHLSKILICLLRINWWI